MTLQAVIEAWKGWLVVLVVCIQWHLLTRGACTMARASGGQTQRRQSCQHPGRQPNNPSDSVTLKLSPAAVPLTLSATSLTSHKWRGKHPKNPTATWRHTWRLHLTSQHYTLFMYTNIGITVKDMYKFDPNIFRPQKQQWHTVSANQPCGRSEVAPMLR